MFISSRPIRWALSTVVALGLLVAASSHVSSSSVTSPETAAEVDVQALAHQRIAQLPLAFEANHGQGEATAQYLARGAGYQISLDPTGATFTFAQARNVAVKSAVKASRDTKPMAPSVVRMTLSGANPGAAGEGLQRQAGVSHYLRSSDSRQWVRGIEHYAQVKYRQVYPGVDLVYYGNQNRLEYDFIVAPRREPEQIALEFDGVQSLRVDERGDLVLSTEHGDLIQHKPLVYQQLEGRRRVIDARYAVLDERRVGFALGDYDHDRELVIDPVLAYSTFLDNSDYAYDITLDKAGNVYVVGQGHLPTPGAADVTITKYNAAGSALLYRTYLGRDNGEDVGLAIAVDAAGQAWVAGQTQSMDFPTTLSALQPTGQGFSAGFVSKLNAAGDGLLYSTYFGYYGDKVNDIAVDAAGNAYITGYCNSGALKTLAALQPQPPAGANAFFAKFNPSGALIYSSYLGGAKTDYGRGIAVGADGSVYVAGATASTDFPLAAARQASNAGGAYDAFLVRIHPAGRPLMRGSYLGGSGSDEAAKVALDRSGNIYLVGDTTSTNFPTANPLRPTSGGLSDAFVTKLTAAGDLVYSTYLGGSGDDFGRAIAVEGNGMVHVTGGTYSGNFPVAAPIMDVAAGQIPSAFVTRLDPAGKSMVSSLLGSKVGGGGAVNVHGEGIAVDLAGNAWVTGYEIPVDVDLNDFPVRAAHQPNWGRQNAFVAKFGAPVARSWQGDFDGDGKSDIFWRNTATGVNTVWRMINNTMVQLGVPRVASEWTVAAVGDFDADGKSDLIWRNPRTGGAVIWPAADGTRARALAPVNNNWAVVGAGDFDADGKSDLLWRDLTTGANVIWKAGNSQSQQSLASAALDWRVVGAGDFDGDGTADILWRNTVTGGNTIWKSATTAQALTTVTNRAWDPVGIADFNGDGRDDILWRDDSVDRNAIWLSASSVTQQGVAGVGMSSFDYVNYGWVAVGSGDYDGDGKADILWRNTVTGENQIWKAAARTKQLEVPDVVDQAWRIFS